MKKIIGLLLAAGSIAFANAATAVTITFDQPNNPSEHYREGGFVLNGLTGPSGGFGGSDGLMAGDYWRVSLGSTLQVREEGFDFFDAISFTAFVVDGDFSTLDVYASYGGDHTGSIGFHDAILSFNISNTSPQTFNLTFDRPVAWLIFVGIAGNIGVALDDISLVPTGSAVPEPATWAMMIAGFGVAGARLRRSRTRQYLQARA